VEKPVPRDNEVLVKIQATTVTAGDCEMRRLELPLMLSFPVRLYAGVLRPKRIPILRQELAGEIVAVGKYVKLFQKGDQVFGTTRYLSNPRPCEVPLRRKISGIFPSLVYTIANVS